MSITKKYIKKELETNTNYFSIKEKYNHLRTLLKDLQKMYKYRIDNNKRDTIDDLFYDANNTIGPIISNGNTLENTLEEVGESYSDIKEKLKNLEIIIKSMCMVLEEYQELIFQIGDIIYEDEAVYFNQNNVLLMGEIFELNEIIKKEAITLEVNTKKLQSLELGVHTLNISPIISWLTQVKESCERLKYNIMTLIGFDIDGAFLSDYMKVLPAKDFFIQITMFEDDNNYLKTQIDEFNKEDYVEYLKEKPFKYLEYLYDFEKYDELENYKEEIEFKLLQ